MSSDAQEAVKVKKRKHQKKNEHKVLQSILGTSRSRIGAKEAIFCRVTQPRGN